MHSLGAMAERNRDSMEKREYQNRPNLLRVATELSGYINPDKVLEILHSVLKSSSDDSTDAKEHLSLHVS